MKKLITAAKSEGQILVQERKRLKGSYETHDVSYLAISQSSQQQKGGRNVTAFTFGDLQR